MKSTKSSSPRRITNLIEQKERGRTVTCFPAFEILPVDFLHRKNSYKAYIFLCRFTGEIDGNAYSFRKCYARGCPHNQCVHVSQAVLIANRYLQRDYNRLAKADIEVGGQLFTLEEMILKFDGYKQEQDTTLTLEDYIEMSKGGAKVDMSINLEYVPAVEHFANHTNSQTFLAADFAVTADNKKHSFQRCLSCYQTDKENEEKALQMEVANARLKVLYQILTMNSVNYAEIFFQ
ncbi:MAG: hypothetical protein V2B20_17550 [Pseudomonadota bacterium]